MAFGFFLVEGGKSAKKYSAKTTTLGGDETTTLASLVKWKFCEESIRERTTTSVCRLSSMPCPPFVSIFHQQLRNMWSNMVKFVSNRVKISSRTGGEVEPYYHHPSKVLPILSTSSITTVIDSFCGFRFVHRGNPWLPTQKLRKNMRKNVCRFELGEEVKPCALDE